MIEFVKTKIKNEFVFSLNRKTGELLTDEELNEKGLELGLPVDQHNSILDNLETLSVLCILIFSLLMIILLNSVNFTSHNEKLVQISNFVHSALNWPILGYIFHLLGLFGLVYLFLILSKALLAIATAIIKK
jgi:hypothetical protein